jgi:hypothetical protein
VRDGDTIVVSDLPITLQGLAAPELGEKSGRDSRDVMQRGIDAERRLCFLTPEGRKMKRRSLLLLFCFALVLFVGLAQSQESWPEYFEEARREREQQLIRGVEEAIANPDPDMPRRRTDETLEDFYRRLEAWSLEEIRRENEANQPAPPTSSEQLGDALEDVGDAISSFFSGDYCDCIFDKMPSVNNDVTASDIKRQCAKTGTSCELQSGSWFGVSSASECIEKYGKKTSSGRAARAIAEACRKAYR